MLLDYIKQIIAVAFLLLMLLGICVVVGCGVDSKQDTSIGKFRDYEYQVRAYNYYVEYIEWGVKRLEGADPTELQMTPEQWYEHMMYKADWKLSKGVFR